MFNPGLIFRSIVLLFIVTAGVTVRAQLQPQYPPGTLRPGAPIPPNPIVGKIGNPTLKTDHLSTTIYSQIARFEDARYFNRNEFSRLLAVHHLGVHKHIALAIGRIGDQHGLPMLLDMLVGESDKDVRVTVVFALGVLNNPSALPNLEATLNNEREDLMVRARAAEAIGKIVSSMAAPANAGAAQSADKLDKDQLALAVARVLPGIIKLLPASDSPSADEKLAASLAISTLFRLRNEAVVAPLTNLLKTRDDDLRWQAANGLYRLRQMSAPAGDALLAGLGDPNPLVIIYCVRAVGVLKDKRAVEPLIGLVTNYQERPADKGQSSTAPRLRFADEQRMVRIEAVKALAQIGDNRAVAPILKLATAAFQKWQDGIAAGASGNADQGEPPELLLLLETALALSSLKDPAALPFLKQLRFTPNLRHAKLGVQPEYEIALARFGEKEFFDMPAGAVLYPNDWRGMANFALGLGAVGGGRARQELLGLLSGKVYGVQPDARAVPDILTALAQVKTPDLSVILREQLAASDVIVRATAAGLIGAAAKQSGEFDQANFDALRTAFDRGKKDDMNDARLAALRAIAQFKTPKLNQALAPGLTDSDYIVRRETIKLLEPLGEENLSQSLGTITRPHEISFFSRVRDLIPSRATATLVTKKGEITIELFTSDAPMTVENFISLAKKGFFNGLTFMRVVPNFVIQGGDPRNDNNGGPGYQIRDEINLRPYERGTVGMALAGKDTGGSQFFICHQAQPQLDGGYTVFGRVTSGMDVVDHITRGDVIERVEIKEER